MARVPRAETKFDYSPELFYSTVWQDLVRQYGHDFNFNAESMAFNAGNRETLSGDVSKRTHDVLLLWNHEDMDTAGVEPMTSLLAIMPGGELWALPTLREWLGRAYRSKTRTRAITKTTREVMLEALKLADVYDEFQDSKSLDFAVRILKAGEISLAVPGNCACILTKKDEYIREPADLSQPSVYWTHNVSHPRQRAERIALYAGMGHVASLAKQDLA